VRFTYRFLHINVLYKFTVVIITIVNTANHRNTQPYICKNLFTSKLHAPMANTYTQQHVV